jgi:hypothetical protein
MQSAVFQPGYLPAQVDYFGLDVAVRDPHRNPGRSQMTPTHAFEVAASPADMS